MELLCVILAILNLFWGNFGWAAFFFFLYVICDD